MILQEDNRIYPIRQYKVGGVLERGGYMPARTVSQLEEELGNRLRQSELIIDGVERPIQRPTEEEKQKPYYSGKKKSTR